MTSNNLSSLKILQWNCNSLPSKLFEFYDFLCEHHIDVAFLCETCLSPSDVLHQHALYKMYRMDRPQSDNERRAGGVAVVVRRNLKHSLNPLTKTRLLETISIDISLNNNKSTRFHSIYLPGGSTNNQIAQYYKRDLRTLTRHPKEYFIIGDFNSKHRLWNCSRANSAGKILYNEYCEQNFIIYHPNSPTYHSSCSNRLPSTIDLMLTNSSLAVSEPLTFPSASDHDYVMTVVKIDICSYSNPNLVPCYRATDWQKFETTVEVELENLPVPTMDEVNSTIQIDELITTLTKAVMTAQREAVPLMPKRRYQLELNAEIRLHIAERNRLIRRLQRNPGLHDMIKPDINQLTQTIKQGIDQVRNRNFNQMLSHLPTDDQNRSLFRTAKFLRNRSNELPPLINGNDTLITSQEKADALAAQFALNHDNPLADDNQAHTAQVNRTVQRFHQNFSPRDAPPKCNTLEIQRICNKMKSSKAPGADRMHNSLIKHLPSIGIFYITFIINCCLKLSYFPAQWKHAEVIAIKKPQKPPNKSSSYRPISLLSSLSKILERVILSRLLEHLDLRSIIPPQQHGFRGNRSTITLLKKVTNDVREALKQKLSTGMILLDVEKAFDRVWHDGLIYKLIKIRTPQYLTKIIASFLSGRSFHVKVHGSCSRSSPIEFGVPQGAVLSPTLYNIYTHDIPIPTDCQISLYADDTAIYKSSRFCKQIIRSLQAANKKIRNYFLRWKILTNDSKTQAIFFSNRRSKQLPREPFDSNGKQIEWSLTIKYLGMILDRKATMKEHISYAVEKTQKAVKILYSMLNRKSKLNIKNKLLLYKVALRPILTYAAPLLLNMAKTHRRKMQTCQNKILRMIFNSPMFTRNADLHEDAEIESVEDFVTRLKDNFDARVGEN